MPEIKHNFTTGKMNKDLDERLVQNGEYRHAVNIQVSTSDDSEVGSVQNILGNSLVEDLTYLPDNTTCLGSIADEKNDAIYWFLKGNSVLGAGLSNGDLEDPDGFVVYTQEDYNLNPGSPNWVEDDKWFIVADGTGLTYSQGVTNPQTDHGITIVGGVAVRGANNGTNASLRQLVDVVQGVEYTISYRRKYITHSVNNGATNFYFKPGPNAQFRQYGYSDEKSGSFVSVTDTFVAEGTGQIQFRIYFDKDVQAEIDDITITTTTQASRILEYDKVNNAINPVFVDINNSVLKFSDSKITGINIINDLLFFTDGTNEPKKINIQRSKENTVDGNSLTTIEDYSGILVPAKEEHITVIKKAPLNAPKIQYNYFRDPNLANTGYINIANNLSNPHTLINSSRGIIYDFGTLSVGDTFETIIETDVNFSNNFTLNWKEGTNVILKAFDPNGTPPSIPLQRYDLKGFITNWEHNEFSNSDELFNVVQTSIVPSGSAWATITQDIEYSFDSATGLDNQKLVFRTHDGVSGKEILNNKKYEISFELAQYNGSLAGDLKVFFFDNTTGTNEYVILEQFADLTNTDVGVYTYTVDGDQYTNVNFTNYANSLLFEASNDVSNSAGNLFNGIVKNPSITRIDSQLAKVQIELTSISGTPPSVPAGETSLNYAIDIYEDFDNVFSDKFSRIAYRYKYKDGEYSFFSPFSNAIFSPSTFRYNAVEGYNLGMENTIKDIVVQNLDSNMPDDVVAIDILYKEDDSPAVYVVDTLKTKDGIFNYKIETNTVKNILPENQLLRSFDNVPIKAKAQEVIGNRIVYGNYQQNYDLEKYNSNTGQNEDFKIDLETKINSKENSSNSGLPSVKSSRDYQVGVVYSDEYGRQTPVLSNSLATEEVQLLSARETNNIHVKINSDGHPVNAKYFKFYVKDIGGDYFNLAMDRWYDAEDGNVWLAFPSSDRNKIDIDDYLFLKKGIETNKVDLTTKNKYKVIDIQNEAPKFIKATSMLISQKRHSTVSPLFTSEAPFKTGNTFSVNYSKYNNSALSQLVELFNSKSLDEDYFIRLAQTNIATAQASSNKYKVFNIEKTTSSPIKLHFSVEGSFGSDIAQFNISQVEDHSAGVIDGTNFIIFKEKIENSARFEGRFFVKILRDEHYNQFVTSTIIDDSEINYTTSEATNKKIYFLESVTDDRFNTPGHHGAGLGNGQHHWGLNTAFDDYTDYDGVSALYPFLDDSTTEPSGNANGDLNAYFESQFRVIQAYGDIDYDSNSSGLTNYSAKGAGNVAGLRSYFRGLNTAVDPDAASSDRVETLHLENDRANAKFEDVWYLNSSKFSYTYPYYTGFEVSTSYPIPNSDTVHDPWKTRTAVTNFNSTNSAILNLSFGGIEPQVTDGWADGTYPYYDNKFFDLVNHTTFGITQGSFIEKISAGSQFRFKEDPSGEVYTITDVQVHYLINIDNLCEGVNQSPPSNINHHARQAGLIQNDFNYGASDLVGYTAANTRVSPGDTPVYNFRTPTFYQAPNFSVNYKINLNKELSWNPVGTPGSPITSGLEIEIAASDANAVFAQTGGLVTLTLDSITGATPGGDDANIEVGMVLEKYRDDGSTLRDITVKPIVTEISFDPTSSKHTVKLRCYSGAFTNLQTSAGVNKVGDIVAADDLIFKQYYMNGMSPNSAKNLNWFRLGGESMIYTGVMPLGYTIEFLNVDEEESPELPSSPAIWETEPKKDKQLNIYYEASDYYTISEDAANLQNLIPVGSIIEHANSDAIPLNTTITGVSIDGTITLSNDAAVEPPGLQPNYIIDRFDT